MAESVSDKKIMDSYLGVLRISSDDGVLDPNVPQSICDSDGHTSSLSISEKNTCLTNVITFGDSEDGAYLTGNITSNKLNASNFSIKGDTGITFTISHNKKDTDGIYITTKEDKDVISFKENEITLNKPTKLLGDVQIDANMTHTILSTTKGDVNVNLKDLSANDVLMVDEEGKKVSFGSIQSLVDAAVKKYLGNTGTEKNHLVPVGSVIYITLPSYDYFRINLKNLRENTNGTYPVSQETYDDNSGAGYSMMGAAQEINRILDDIQFDVSMRFDIKINQTIDVEEWTDLNRKKSDVSYLDGIDITKPTATGIQKLFNECICAVSGLELRMPKDYLGYWDFCLGQSATTFNDPVVGSGHTPYTNINFPKLWDILKPLDVPNFGEKEVSFCLPDLGYNFIRCAGQDVLQGQSSQVILQSKTNPNNSTVENPVSVQVLPFNKDLVENDTYNNRIVRDQHMAPIITKHQEPTTITQKIVIDDTEETTVYTYVATPNAYQQTDYRGISRGISMNLTNYDDVKTKDGSFCLYSYISPDTYLDDGMNKGMTNNKALQPDGVFWVHTNKTTTGYYSGGGGAKWYIYTSRYMLDLMNTKAGKRTRLGYVKDFLDNSVYRRETYPRHSVLIPIIKIRDMS